MVLDSVIHVNGLFSDRIPRSFDTFQVDTYMSIFEDPHLEYTE